MEKINHKRNSVGKEREIKKAALKYLLNKEINDDTNLSEEPVSLYYVNASKDNIPIPVYSINYALKEQELSIRLVEERLYFFKDLGNSNYRIDRVDVNPSLIYNLLTIRGIKEYTSHDIFDANNSYNKENVENIINGDILMSDDDDKIHFFVIKRTINTTNKLGCDVKNEINEELFVYVVIV